PPVPGMRAHPLRFVSLRAVLDRAFCAEWLRDGAATRLQTASCVTRRETRNVLCSKCAKKIRCSWAERQPSCGTDLVQPAVHGETSCAGPVLAAKIPRVAGFIPL